VTLRIGTRRSALALAQAREVAELLEIHDVKTELVPMSTAGDRGAQPTGSTAGMKGLWVSEIVRSLLEGDVDLAVHSAKDLPAEDDPGVVLAAVPERASALDVLVTREGELPPGSKVGTSSLRRRAQVFRWRPDVLVTDIRGNVDTRLRKLDAGEVDAIVLAAAGLLRLGVVPEHAAPMSVAEMVPAPGQGCLAVQVRADDAETRDAVAALDHEPSRLALEAERALVARLEAGCALPLGAFGQIADDRVALDAVVLTPDGERVVRAAVDAPTPAEAAELAALDLLAGGADEILRSARSS
jgi:hydroxymethylbilane synthase